MPNLTREGISREVRLHRCDHCGKIAVWSKGWAVFGSIAHNDNGFREFISCSDKCRSNYTEKELVAIVGRVSRGVLVGSNWSLLKESKSA